MDRRTSVLLQVVAERLEAMVKRVGEARVRAMGDPDLTAKLDDFERTLIEILRLLELARYEPGDADQSPPESGTRSGDRLKEALWALVKEAIEHCDDIRELIEKMWPF